MYVFLWSRLDAYSILHICTSVGPSGKNQLLLDVHLCSSPKLIYVFVVLCLQDIPTLETSPMWQEMAPSGKGCIKLYNAMMSGNHNE